MNQNKCIFLGTGTSQGVPVIGCVCEVCTSMNPHDNRLRSSVLLSIGGKNIVIDTGPDFRQQMLRAQTRKLDAILLTHEHNDHIIGLDDIRPFNFMQKQPISLYSSKELIHTIRSKFDYIFSEERYPGAPSIKTYPIGNEPFEIQGVSMMPIHYMHGNIPVVGFRVFNFAYITDIKSIDEEEVQKLKELDILVVSALHHKTHHSHFNLEEALSFIKRVGPSKAYLTHLSHRMGLSKSVKKALPPNVDIAYDGLELTIT